MLFSVLGVLSAIIFIVCDIPYLWDTIKARTKPHRVTWGVVVLLNSTGFANQWASGADNSLWLFGASVAMTAAIFVAAIPNGVGGHTKSDMFSITACTTGLALWAAFESPLLSILANLFVVIVALLPTFAKAKKEPDTETKIAWLGGAISAALAAVSVGKLDFQLLVLPGTAALLQGYMVYLLYFAAKKVSAPVDKASIV